MGAVIKKYAGKKNMKIAVTSKADKLETEVDPRFGRAPYILIVDSDSLDFDSIDNTENKNAFKGAGIQAAAMIAELNADILITGYCGPNAFKTLTASGIKVIDNQKGPIIEVVNKFNRGELVCATEANTDGHW